MSPLQVLTHTYKHILSRLPIPFALHPPSALHHTLDHQPIPPMHSPSNADFPIVVTPSGNVSDVIPQQSANKPSHIFIDQACHYHRFRPLPLVSPTLTLVLTYNLTAILTFTQNTGHSLLGITPYHILTKTVPVKPPSSSDLVILPLTS